MALPWETIRNNNVLHYWEPQCDKDCENHRGDEVAVHPDYYQENGEPSCGFCGQIFEYLRTRVLIDVPKWTVYHVDDHYAFNPDKDPHFPINFHKVAVVECQTIDEAFRLTNHIDHSWEINTELLWYEAKCRSTSVGDIIVDDHGGIHQCENVGWKRLDK